MNNSILNSIPFSSLKRPIIAIVGSGFSGTLVAVHLLRMAAQPVTIILIDRNGEYGRGVAYSTTLSLHLLNVPAGKMSAFPDEPDHFLTWLHDAGYVTIEAATFVSRHLYGSYVQSLLEQAIAGAPAHVTLHRVMDEAIAIEVINDRTTLRLRNGTELQADKVVLALGNFQAALPTPFAALPRYKSYVRNAWAKGAISGLKANDPVLIVGTGLTMVDAVIALREQGHQGSIYAVSRHGLRPQRHQPYIPYPNQLAVSTAPKTARGLVRWVRNEVQLAIARGYDWRAVIDALRPISQPLWQRLSTTEQRRFLRHAKPYWEVHRHRVAPQMANILECAVAQGQLMYQSGRVQSCYVEGDRVHLMIQPRHQTTQTALTVCRILNCTGFNCDYQQLPHPFIDSLRTQNLIQFNPIRLGIETTNNGAVIQANGKASDILYTLGTPRKGNLWETTAIPELRVQAQALAAEILNSLGATSSMLSPTALAPRW
ncbi:FAD/NAD(P)-binding protein [Leptolyngbya sp. AN02str]|uniref:FAD/NAD(P)-binding protein n=1 Tax=Leptolyngbya sp. AN02str TaxID=3423363 RepID=UPI003D3242F9